VKVDCDILITDGSDCSSVVGIPETPDLANIIAPTMLETQEFSVTL